MTALLASEIRRFLVRPLVRAFTAGALLAVVITAVAILATSNKDTATNVRLLESQREQAVRSCVEEGFNPPLSSISADDRREFCANEVLPPTRFTFRLTQVLDIIEGVDFKGSAIPLVIVSFLLGASFTGAEWLSGGIMTLLAWESRRRRVLVATIAVPAAALFVGVLAFQSVLGAVLWPVAILKGTVEGADLSWVVSVGNAGLRVAVVAAVAAGLGSSLAMIGRSTTAALGVAVMYAIAEVLIRGFENPAWQRWLIGENATIFVTAELAAAGGFSPVGALGIVLALSVGAMLIATRSFLHRDVV